MKSTFLKNLKFHRPTTSSKRQLISIKKNHLKKTPLLKSKLIGMKNSSGRNHSGSITVRHIGGGNKQRYRSINFNRNYDSIAVICSIEYDPNRTAFIASAYDIKKNNFFYVLAPIGLTVGDIIKSGETGEPSIGHSLPLSEIPVGSFIHNISSNPGKGGVFTRAAGTCSMLIEKTSDYAQVRLFSGRLILVPVKCYATVGVVSNGIALFSRDGKAGRSRWKNVRPAVRGVAMNPVDHPHGGGEGKKSGKSVSPWGKPTKPKNT